MPDDTKLLDLDDPEVLVRLGLRPTDVVRRYRDHTQGIVLRLWLDRVAGGLGCFGYTHRDHRDGTGSGKPVSE